jgi:hypothetical protein
MWANLDRLGCVFVPLTQSNEGEFSDCFYRFHFYMGYDPAGRERPRSVSVGCTRTGEMDLQTRGEQE